MNRALHREDFGDNLINDYLNVFSTYSFKNELYGKISLHVLIGQALKNVYYRMGSRVIDVRVHLLLIKPQGTGKGAGYGFVERMATALGLRFESLTEATDAGLIGSVQYDPIQKKNVLTEGLLKTADIVGMEEADVLFDLSNDFSRKGMTYFQIAMNPLNDESCTLTKQLSTQKIQFKPHASLVLCSYPPDSLVDKLLKTGFIDRIIPIFEDVTLADRLEVIKKMSENINISTRDSFAEQFNDVYERLQAVINNFSAKTNPVEINISQKIHSLILQVIDEFAMKILDASPKAREKLEHFISRMYETLLKLSIHHALLSYRQNVEVVDVLYARLTYMPIWRNLIISVESLLIISPIEKSRRHRIIRQSIEEFDRQAKVGKYVKKDKTGVWVRRLTMVENLQHKWDSCSRDTADNNLYKLEKVSLSYSKVTRYEKDKYFERKYFGDTAYLRKIKDV